MGCRNGARGCGLFLMPDKNRIIQCPFADYELTVLRFPYINHQGIKFFSRGDIVLHSGTIIAEHSCYCGAVAVCIPRHNGQVMWLAVTQVDHTITTVTMIDRIQVTRQFTEMLQERAAAGLCSIIYVCVKISRTVIADLVHPESYDRT